VYEFSKLIGNVSATSFSVAGLVLGGTYSFKVEAGDAWGNYTIDGPGLTVRVLAQGAILGYVAWYVGPPYQGGSTLIVSNFTSFGQDPVSATRVTMTGDLGSFLVPGLPLNLTSGENRIVNMTITIPTSAYVGNHTVTITVYWNYRDAQTGVWNSASPITITGKIPVLAGPGPSTGPSSPSSSNNRPSVPRDILGLLAGLPEMAGQLILPGLAVYLLLVITAIGLVSRNGRKRAILHASYRTCLNCKTPAGAYDVFCGTCGTRLPP
jgi:hypothetical protein